MSKSDQDCRDTATLLRDSEARYDLAIRGTNDGIWDWDRETDSVYFSPRWKAIIGFEDHELPNDLEEWKKRIHPEDRERVLEVNNLFFNDPEAGHFSVEYRIRHKQGHYLWILGRGTCLRDESGMPYRMAGAHTDIDRSKRHEEALRRSERKWRNILVNTPQLGISIDAEGTITFANEYFCTLTGWSHEEVLGKNWFETFIPADQRETIRNYFLSLFSHGSMEEFYHRESELVCRNGKTLLVAWSNVFSRDLDGQFVDVTCLGVDLTERERFKASLQCAKDYAESANHAKSFFLATMSHEIRTPLNGIMGMLQLALTTNLDEEGRDYISTAFSSSQDLLRILSDVLDLSRIEAGLLEIAETDFPANLMILPVISSLEGMAGSKGLRLRYEIAPNVPLMLRGDIGRIRQILVNLVNNAIKYTQDGGVVLSLDVDGEPLKGVCKVRFRVRDTGHGIPMDRLDEIWEPFSQLNTTSYSTEYGGIGLGLSIVRKLVDAMGGRISIDSVVGQGTTATVVLPLEIGDENFAQNQREAQSGLEETKAKAWRVLLVEDDPLNKMAIKNMLLKIGVDVDVASNGKEAVDQALGQRYDLIFMDVQMPYMNGLEATKRIREQAGPAFRVPIVAITAYAMREDRETFLASGMDDYVSKPVEFETLAQVLAKHLGDDELARQAPVCTTGKENSTK